LIRNIGKLYGLTRQKKEARYGRNGIRIKNNFQQEEIL